MADPTWQDTLKAVTSQPVGPGAIAPMPQPAIGEKNMTKIGDAPPTAVVPKPAPTSVNGQPVPANTPANVPSSSASTIVGQNANTATTNTTNPVNPNIKLAGTLAASLKDPNISSDTIQGLLDSGLDTSTAIGIALQQSSKISAQQATQKQEAQQQAQYQADLAAQNAQYAQQTQALATHKQDAINTATAQLASVSGGTLNSASTGFMAHIGATYDQAQNQLNLMAEQAKAALDSGNVKAYAAINDQMNNVITTTNNNISNLLTSFKASQTASAQFAQTEQDKAVTQYQSALVNQPQTEFANLSPDYSQLTPDQQKSVQGSQAYQLAIKGGLTPEAAYQGIHSAATSAFKQQAAAAKLEQLQIDSLRQQAADARANRVQTAETNVVNTETNLLASGIKTDTGDGVGSMMKASVGGKELTPAELDKISSFTALSQKMPDVISALNDLNKGSTVGNIIAGSTPWDQKVQVYEGQMLQVLNPIARGVYGEVGRISATDEGRVLKSAGDRLTTDQIRNQLMAGVLTSIKNNISAQMTTLAKGGRDVSAFSAQTKVIIDDLNTQIDLLKPITSTDSSGKPVVPKTASIGFDFNTPSFMSGANSFFGTK